jgi:predicted XRE-type DNA-binding protein
MKAKQSEISYELGSENVFFDLGMADAEEKLAKAELAFKINQLIEKRGFKQAEAAKLLKIDQAKISLLHRGRLSGFSMERLIKYLSILDQDIEIVIKPHRARVETHLRVVFQKA